MLSAIAPRHALALRSASARAAVVGSACGAFAAVIDLDGVTVCERHAEARDDAADGGGGGGNGVSEAGDSGAGAGAGAGAGTESDADADPDADAEAEAEAESGFARHERLDFAHVATAAADDASSSMAAGEDAASALRASFRASRFACHRSVYQGGARVAAAAWGPSPAPPSVVTRGSTLSLLRQVRAPLPPHAAPLLAVCFSDGSVRVFFRAGAGAGAGAPTPASAPAPSAAALTPSGWTPLWPEAGVGALRARLAATSLCGLRGAPCDVRAGHPERKALLLVGGAGGLAVIGLGPECAAIAELDLAGTLGEGGAASASAICCAGPWREARPREAHAGEAGTGAAVEANAPRFSRTVAVGTSTGRILLCSVMVGGGASGGVALALLRAVAMPGAAAVSLLRWHAGAVPTPTAPSSSSSSFSSSSLSFSSSSSSSSSSLAVVPPTRAFEGLLVAAHGAKLSVLRGAAGASAAAAAPAAELPAGLRARWHVTFASAGESEGGGALRCATVHNAHDLAVTGLELCVRAPFSLPDAGDGAGAEAEAEGEAEAELEGKGASAASVLALTTSLDGSLRCWDTASAALCRWPGGGGGGAARRRLTTLLHAGRPSAALLALASRAPAPLLGLSLGEQGGAGLFCCVLRCALRPPQLREVHASVRAQLVPVPLLPIVAVGAGDDLKEAEATAACSGTGDGGGGGEGEGGGGAAMRLVALLCDVLPAEPAEWRRGDGGSGGSAGGGEPIADEQSARLRDLPAALVAVGRAACRAIRENVRRRAAERVWGAEAAADEAGAHAGAAAEAGAEAGVGLARGTPAEAEAEAALDRLFDLHSLLLAPAEGADMGERTIVGAAEGGEFYSAAVRSDADTRALCRRLPPQFALQAVLPLAVRRAARAFFAARAGERGRAAAALAAAVASLQGVLCALTTEDATARRDAAPGADALSDAIIALDSAAGGKRGAKRKRESGEDAGLGLGLGPRPAAAAGAGTRAGVFDAEPIELRAPRLRAAAALLSAKDLAIGVRVQLLRPTGVPPRWGAYACAAGPALALALRMRAAADALADAGADAFAGVGEGEAEAENGAEAAADERAGAAISAWASAALAASAAAALPSALRRELEEARNGFQSRTRAASGAAEAAAAAAAASAGGAAAVDEAREAQAVACAVCGAGATVRVRFARALPAAPPPAPASVAAHVPAAAAAAALAAMAAPLVPARGVRCALGHAICLREFGFARAL